MRKKNIIKLVILIFVFYNQVLKADTIYVNINKYTKSFILRSCDDKQIIDTFVSDTLSIDSILYLYSKCHSKKDNRCFSNVFNLKIKQYLFKDSVLNIYLDDLPFKYKYYKKEGYIFEDEHNEWRFCDSFLGTLYSFPKIKKVNLFLNGVDIFKKVFQNAQNKVYYNYSLAFDTFNKINNKYLYYLPYKFRNGKNHDILPYHFKNANKLDINNFVKTFFSFKYNQEIIIDFNSKLASVKYLQNENTLNINLDSFNNNLIYMTKIVECLSASIYKNYNINIDYIIMKVNSTNKKYYFKIGNL